jgi:hypothetical protein
VQFIRSLFFKDACRELSDQYYFLCGLDDKERWMDEHGSFILFASFLGASMGMALPEIQDRLKERRVSEQSKRDLRQNQ